MTRRSDAALSSPVVGDRGDVYRQVAQDHGERVEERHD